MVEPVQIGLATLYCGDALAIMPEIGAVDHMIFDGPYEKIMHDSKSGVKGLVRPDGSHHRKPLDFAPIDEIRDEVVEIGAVQCKGWFVSFCTSEGVGRWADSINTSSMKYKRACVWIKPDSTPQMNGQGPAQGAEHFVCAWAGKGFAKWNAGGKRGVYTHLVNNPERTGLHPTEKPRRLMSEIIADFTNPGQLVCDPFSGVGTTGVAAVMAGRRFIGIEQNETYFQIMCDRLDKAQRQGQLFEAAA